jgi:hypothetical protein
MAKLQPYLFGILPVGVINASLELELDAGEVVMPVNAQIHAQRKRPADYARCFPHVAAVIAEPLYLGDDFRNQGKIEMIGRPLALGVPLLVAVELTKDVDGRYSVTSFYPISEKKVENRRLKRHLIIAVPEERAPRLVAKGPL